MGILKRKRKKALENSGRKHDIDIMNLWQKM